MGILSNLFDRLVGASVKRVRSERREAALSAVLATTDGPPITSRTRSFTIYDAMNGSYIEFTKRKYNPHGPDDFQREIYIVKDGETVMDAISTVLVLTEK